MVSQAGNPTAGKVSKLLSNTEFAKDETSEVERLAVGRTVTELGLRRMNHHLFGYYKDVCSERSSESDSLLSELPTSQIATFAERKHKDNYFECAKVEQVGKDRTPGPRPEVRGNVFSVEVTDPSITSGACISFCGLVMVDPQVRALPPLMPLFPCNDCELRNKKRVPLYAASHAARILLTRIENDAENFAKLFPPEFPGSRRRFPDITVRIRAAGTRTIILSDNRNTRGRPEWPPHLLYSISPRQTRVLNPRKSWSNSPQSTARTFHQFCPNMEYEPRKGFLMVGSALQ